MDQELLSMLAQVDATLNSLLINPNVSKDELSKLQNERNTINKRLMDFKDELLRRSTEFKSTINRDIQSLSTRIATAAATKAST
jgi:predicted  nucleic acid-binding Zn-ribbon protein